MSGTARADAGSARWFSRIVRRETAIGVAINSVAGGVAFLVVFGFADLVAVRGLSGIGVDFIPQTFMMSLMGSLIPGLLTRRRFRRSMLLDRVPKNSGIVVHSFVIAIAAAFFLGGAALLASRHWLGLEVPHAFALTLKVAYSAALAAIVTPCALIWAFRQAVRP